MTLSKIAQNILKSPNEMLQIDHSEKKAIEPEHIYVVKGITSLDKKSFSKALTEIRNIVSRRGSFSEKPRVQDSMYNYSRNLVFGGSSGLNSVNQLNNHLKGVWGGELPRKYREEFHTYFRENTESTSESNSEVPTSEKSKQNLVSLTIEGLSFSLSEGSSLTIGELNTKTLDFKGLKSITIEKVEGGCLYGVSLKA